MAGAADLDWDDLRYFLAAARAKTLAGAARALGVEHTTVGRRLSALERAVGGPVVLRRPDGLQLTALGEQLLPHAEEIEHRVGAVREAASAHQTRVRLAVPSGFTPLFAGGLVRLRREHGVTLDIVSGSSTVNLGKGEADLSIRSGPVADESLLVRKLAESGWSVYAAPSYLSRHPEPIDLEDLSGHEVIGYDPSLAGVPAAQWLQERAVNATVVLRSREMTDMCSAARSGVGIAVMPCFIGDADPGLVRLTSSVVARREVSLVYRKEMKQSKAVRAVVAFVMETMHDHAARLSGATPTSARGRQPGPR